MPLVSAALPALGCPPKVHIVSDLLQSDPGLPATGRKPMEGLSAPQYLLVYNAFSFTFATMAAATLFLWLSRSQVAPRYRTALLISGLVTAIAAYHYWRIFQSWEGAYEVKDNLVVATGYGFNDAYRY